MVQKNSTQFKPAFFGSRINKVLSSKLTYVNVGGNGDCGFRSVAAAIIDNFLFKKSTVEQAAADKALIKKLLGLHAFYLEKPKSLSEQELVELLKQPAARAEFLVELAMVLRQEAVTEMSKHPENYPGAFVADNEKTSPKEMRLQSTWIDENAIASLSKVFQLPIEVRVVEPKKELFASQKKWRRNYRPDFPASQASPEALQVASPIVMQLQANHYIPKVNNPEFFESIPRFNVSAVEPKVIAHQDPELEEALARIAALDKRLDEEFQSTVKWLTTTVQDEKITKEKLIDIYIKSLNDSDYLQGRIKYVGIEHGNQHFFEAIESRKGEIKPISLSKAGHDDLVTVELIHALARGISIGQVDPALIYESLEKPSIRLNR